MQAPRRPLAAAAAASIRKTPDKPGPAITARKDREQHGLQYQLCQHIDAEIPIRIARVAEPGEHDGKNHAITETGQEPQRQQDAEAAGKDRGQIAGNCR